MVASGVPNENENRHVFEISEVALEFREVIHQPIHKHFHTNAIASGFIHVQGTQLPGMEVATPHRLPLWSNCCRRDWHQSAQILSIWGYCNTVQWDIKNTKMSLLRSGQLCIKDAIKCSTQSNPNERVHCQNADGCAQIPAHQAGHCEGEGQGRSEHLLVE